MTSAASEIELLLHVIMDVDGVIVLLAEMNVGNVHEYP